MHNHRGRRVCSSRSQRGSISGVLSSKDVEGRDRIVIQVGADGAPVLQLLDINGKGNKPVAPIDKSLRIRPEPKRPAIGNWPRCPWGVTRISPESRICLQFALPFDRVGNSLCVRFRQFASLQQRPIHQGVGIVGLVFRPAALLRWIDDCEGVIGARKYLERHALFVAGADPRAV